MKEIFFLLSALFRLTAGKPCGSDRDELLLSLNKELLRSTQGQDSLPNPSVHIALRLSSRHSLDRESQYLEQLKTKFHEDLQNSLNEKKPVVGRLALYVMALKSSCQDLSSVTLKVGETSEHVITHLKRQMEMEKEHLAFSQYPMTNYYQYALGILALCVSGVRVNIHVTHKLIHAVLHEHISHGTDSCTDLSPDTLAMAGMALQCLKEVETPVKDVAEFKKALSTIKEKLKASELSSGITVQALIAMSSDVKEISPFVEALWSDVQKDSYKNPMAISQALPALHNRSYLHLRSLECCSEDDSLVLDDDPVVASLPTITTKVPVQVAVLKADGQSFEYWIDVSSGSSLLTVLTLLQEQNTGFTFESEDSLWGPFLSRVNGEQARQTDRRYWHLSSDGKSLSQGIKDYIIKEAQKFTIKNIEY